MKRRVWRPQPQFPGRRSRRFLTGVLVAGSACALITACSRPTAQRLNQDGNRAYGRGDYPTALENYRKAQVERPDLAALNYNAGNVLNQQADYPRAISESLRATSGNDADARTRAFYSIGSDYYRQGKLKDALDAFKNALRLDPSDVDTKFNVEVIQRQLDAQAQQQKTQQQSAQNQQGNQQNQQGQQQGQQGQQNQQGQQGQQGQPGQQGQQGQQASGQQQGASQAAQGNPSGQQSQSGTQSGAPPGDQQPSGAAGQPAGQPAGTPGPSVREQQAQVNQDLQSAIGAYQKQPSIEEALRILDLIAQQDQLNQATQGSRGAPNPRDK